MKEKRQKFYFILFVLFFTGLLIFINVSKAETIVFSEMMYDPVGSDTGNEWIELLNKATSSISILSDYRLNDGSNHLINHYSGSTKILSGGFFVITQNAANFLSNYPDYSSPLFESSFSLNNSAGIAGLLQGSNLITEQAYTSVIGGNGNGKTIQRVTPQFDDNVWTEGYVIGGTPGALSNSLPVNYSPVAVINVSTTTIQVGDDLSFDASSSTDANGDVLTYLWNIDSVASSTDIIFNYCFTDPGTYNITLFVSDGNLSGTQSVLVNVLENDELITTPTSTIDYIGKIIINELLPNPEGSDDAEWIELKNISDIQINLQDFYIQDDSGKKYVFSGDDFEDLVLDSDEYFVLEYSMSHVTLNNSGDKIYLFDKDANKISEIVYTSSIEGNSWARFGNDWQWTKILTPGEDNDRKIIYKPEAIINFTGDLAVDADIKFSAKNSQDLNGEDLEFKWYVDDYLKSRNPEFTTSFDKSGLKSVKLVVINDSGLEDGDVKSINIEEAIKESFEEASVVCSSTISYGGIIISELFPNPKGVDDGEFIELYNPNDYDVDLSSWSMNDTSSYFYKLNQKILAKSYISIYKSDSKISLNNSNESLKIFDCNKNLIWAVEYDKSIEDKSYSYNFLDGKYYFVDPTPNEENYFPDLETGESYSISGVQEELVDNAPDFGDSFYGVAVSGLGDIKKNVFYVCPYDLKEKIADYENCFESKLSGVDVKVNIGDVAEIFGDIKNTDNKNTLKIYDFKTMDNIKLEDLEIYEIEDINNLNLNSFVSISGEISKVNKKSFYIGTEDAKVKIKFNSIGDLQLNKADNVIVRGVVVKDGDVNALYIKDENDILIQRVLGVQEVSSSTEEMNNLNINEDKNKNLIGYFIAGIAILGVGFYFVRNKFIKK